MPSPGFSMNTSLYRTVAEQLDALRTEVGNATTHLRDTTLGSGNPFGDDQQGSLFGQLYQQGLSHVLDCVITHQDQITYAADSLRESADAHDANDQNVEAVFNSLAASA